ncbi:hypothetical protein [Spirilliplanes yamanashiensis]|uniref:ATP synthase protein I n=1 Tax=Spirilliplanes yamanashiensis TaxID=42233 RepID=A0A8J4DHM0_9ACTN|nr:hypothetical protein [Spirilliplanes yamanashiensis]MDP9819921.1 hypothetical protein [Spirilliplanes yamanashiensis]GIJ01260.1 hypothetical protein Sya03_06120 [Spirilliplanes yamanashiensis]
MSAPDAEPAAGVTADRPAVPAQRLTFFGPPRDDDDRPLPQLPPLPADPRWRIEHLPMVAAAGFALVFCAGSAGFFLGGPTAALGAAAGVFVVTVGATMSTLAIAWADAVRPALVMPVGLLAYVIKFALVAFVMLSVGESGWAGGVPMAWGLAGGVVALTAVQAWWVARLARRHLPDGPPGTP